MKTKVEHIKIDDKILMQWPQRMCRNVHSIHSILFNLWNVKLFFTHYKINCWHVEKVPGASSNRV